VIVSSINLTCSYGTNVALGENEQTFTEDRSVTFQRYANAVPSTPGGDFQSDLIDAPYRIIEPSGAGFNAGGADQSYYADYISDIWSFNGITIPEAGPNGSGPGSTPSLSAAIYRHTASTSGTPEFNAAGALTSPGMWGNPASFYQLEPLRPRRAVDRSPSHQHAAVCLPVRRCGWIFERHRLFKPGHFARGCWLVMHCE
jgi:hypothetical protein